MGIQFITDSTADLTKEYIEANGIRLIPMIYQMDGQEYYDSPLGGVNTQTRKEFYDAMRAGAQPTTSQINEITFTEAFEEILSQGDDAFFISFSSGLTGSLNNARLACETLKEKYPERTVYMVDSLSASQGEGLLVHMGIEAMKSGKTPEEVKAYLDEARFCIHHRFTVEDLVYLKRGGRISAATAAVGTMLSIKPMLSVDDEGHLVSQEKAKGRKKALKSLVAHLVEKAGEDFAGDIYLVHSDASEADIDFTRAAVQQQFGRDVTQVSTLSPIIGAHTGPGLVALIFHTPGSSR
ncbi:MAG: DegV family protein [Clostridia bacterium]|nr:DegV family protein [Clostridia bacterium]